MTDIFEGKIRRHFIIAICLLLSFQLWAAMPKQRVIIDCDLAGDIDDAFALALALTSPELQIEGIIMDHGLTEKRAQVACKLLYLTGREDIPVLVGRQTPSIVGRDSMLAPVSPQFYWAEGFSRLKPSGQNAADFIIKKLRQSPHEIILITTGPLPNIMDVLQKDPQVLKLAKHVYAMFGSFYMGYDGSPIPSAEWNVAADVQAAQAFLNSGAQINLAGLDVTTLVRLEKGQREKLWLRKSPLTDALSSLYVLWGYETPVLYDAVAIGMIIWPDLFSLRDANVRVAGKGFTTVQNELPANCAIGLGIEKEEFIARMMQRLLQQNLDRENK
jgi:purine nucleosidase